MKPQIQLQLTSKDKTLGILNLAPDTHRRLQAYAKANRVSLTDMVALALRFTLAPDMSPVDIQSPDL
jgi:hypothetical protein